MKKLTRTIIILSFFVSLMGCVSTATSESTGQYIDSATTTTKVKTKLARTLGAGSLTGIEVNTYKGVVQLSGFVNNKKDIQRAVNAARSVSGVIAVENSLLVKSKLK